MDDPHPVRPAAHRPAHYPVGGALIGREAARTALTAALDVANSGRAATVVVEGEAGSGKTLLVEWLLAEAAQRAVRHVAVRPVEGEADLPLAVMADVIRSLADLLPALAVEHREVLAAAAGGAGRASTDRLLLAAATLALLTSAAEDAPLLLVVDDAQWVDLASGQALSFAVRRLLADRITVVLARRPAEQERVRGPWDVVRLEGLTALEVVELVAAATGVTPPATVVTRILEETRGNPLAVSHLAARLPRAALAGEAPLPLTLPLQEVARRTFAGLVIELPPATRAALAVVAAAGSAAARLVPAALPGLDLDLVDLVAAEEAGLLRVGGGTLEFAHPLYRASALEVAGPSMVRRAHAALAAAAHGGDLQRHAWHRGLSVLGVDEDAAATLARAADAAESRAGAAASVGMRGLAVVLSPPGPARDRRELAAARALSGAGHHAEARGHLQAVLDRDGVPPDVRADAFHQMSRLMLWDTPLDAQPVAEAIPDDLPPRQRAATLAVAALRARNMAELQRYGDLARAAHAQVTALLPDRPRWDSADDVAETLFLLPTLALIAEADLVSGQHRSVVVADLIERIRRLLAAARGGEPEASAVKRGLVRMLDELVGSPVQTLIWTPALDLAAELLTLWLSAARARPASLAYLLLARTELAGWTGDLLGGLHAADRAIEVSREIGSHVLTGWAHTFASRICAARADERGYAEHARAAVELGARLNEPGPQMWTAHSRGQLLLGTGRAVEAVETLAPVAAYATSIRFRGVRAIPWQPDHVEALSRAGRPAEADAALTAWLATMPAEPDDWHRAVIDRCLVLVRGEEHVDALMAALDIGALRRTPLEEARAQLVAGSALRRRRRPAAARAMTRAAVTTFTRLGAAGWRALAEAELADRRRSGRAVDDGVGLTAQEMRVAQEVASGATTREAAARLFCSPKTVEYHLTRVYAKLGVRSRAALAVRLTGVNAVPAG
jgi:DNA-binding CsgD family transcriptional regulator